MQCVITLVHGTWAREARWTRAGSPLTTKLRENVSGLILPAPFRWSGRNSVGARYKAATQLRVHLHQLIKTYPTKTHRHFVVGHSHGGNVMMLALRDAELAAQVHGIVCLSTPFLSVRTRAVGDFGLKRLHRAATLYAILCLLATLFIPVANHRIGYRVLRALEDSFRALSLDALFLFVVLWGAPLWLWLLFRGLSALISRASTHWRAWANRIKQDCELPSETGVTTLVLRVEHDEASGALWAAQAAARLISTTWSTVSEIVQEFHQAKKGRDQQDFETMMARGGSVLDLPKRIPVAGAIGLFLLWLWNSGDTGARFSAVALSPILLVAFPQFGAVVVMMVALPLVFIWSAFLLPYGWEFLLSSIALDVSATTTPPGRSDLHQLPRVRFTFRNWKAWANQRLGLRHSATYRDPDALNLLVTWIRTVNESPIRQAID